MRQDQIRKGVDFEEVEGEGGGEPPLWKVFCLGCLCCGLLV